MKIGGGKWWFIAVAVIGLVFALLAGACSKAGVTATQYHCPMHPTYVSDKPGDCPICGMRLVPIKDAKSASENGGSKPHHEHSPRTSAPGASVAPSATNVWTCPMHPEVVSDKPGRCPKCGMDLVQKAADPAPSGSSSLAAPPPSGERRILYYRSPMDPKVTSPTPAKDSMGMDFVPVYSDEVGPTSTVAGYASFDVDQHGMRLAGVRTAVAQRSRIERTIRAAGVVRPDETRVRHVHTKTAGWIEKLFISFTGQPVQKGRPILSMYSQELLASQQEYLRVREASQKLDASSDPAVRSGVDDMVAGSRRRLELFDVSPKAIAELDRTGVPQRGVTLLAPVSGIVTGKEIFEGMQVEPGMELFTVSDLSSVWIEADVYDNEASVVRVGQQAQVVLPSDPGAPLTGKVKYVYPYLNPETRTIKVRFDFPNPGLKLKLDMYVSVELPVQTDEGVVVPDSAVMDTGVRQIAFVMPKEGRFEPRQVKVGIRADGKAQILSGVNAGERVATKANFLLDSESRLRAAISGAAAAAPVASGATP